MSYRILVIEDNPINMELVTDLLEAAGFHVFPAATGEQGLRAAEVFAPDLILMDLSLPGLDGLATTRALRQNPATSQLPIVALTAHAMKGDEAITLSAGCNGYLTKPIDTRTFVSHVSAYLTGTKEPHSANVPR
jgi:CheY-like chemotaxis protein